MRIRWEHPEFRRILASCLCIILFPASSHSHDHKENCWGGEFFKGDVLISNNSKKNKRIHFTYSGPESGSIHNINPGHSRTKELPHGEYSFKLEVINYETHSGWDDPVSVSKRRLGNSGKFVIFEGSSVEITWP